MNKIKGLILKCLSKTSYNEPDMFLVEKSENDSLTCLDIGCGTRKVKGCIGLDKADLPGVDVICDFNKEPLPFADNSMDIVYTNGGLGMSEDLGRIMGEIHRVLKKNTGLAKIYVPHFSNPYAYSAYTNKTNFGYFTLDSFVKKNKQKSEWKIPDWYQDFYFEITDKKLFFRSEFKLLHIPFKILQYLVNKNDSMARFYEFHLCYIFPAYGIKVEMRPDRDDGTRNSI
ncbi:MAG: methyltransferase domain-containing protein [bacterium]|nr:methyltransferase domain-containing protein [bacterium]